MTRESKFGMLPRSASCLLGIAKTAALRLRATRRAFPPAFLATMLMVTSASGTPEDDEPRLSMAVAQTDEGAAVVSIAELRSRTLPKHVRKLFGKAVKLDKKGNTSQALACLNLALDTAPEFIQAHVAAAIGYLKLGEPDLAQKHLTVALEIDDSYVPAVEVQGILLFRWGRLEEARKALEDLLKAAPGRRTIHSYLSLILEKQGHAESAIEHRQTAEQLRHRPFRPFQQPLAVLDHDGSAGRLR